MEGMNGDVGDLLLLPRSHKSVMDRGAMNLFVRGKWLISMILFYNACPAPLSKRGPFWEQGTADLPGALVLNDVPRGSMILVHSAVAHARRPKPGTTTRYFTNVGYNAGGTAMKWPAYNSMEQMDEINAVALQQGHHRPDSDGSLAFLFDHHRVFTGGKLSRTERV
jgi:hypothetical protein